MLTEPKSFRKTILHTLLSVFAPPTFEDDAQNHAAALLHTVLLILLGCTIVLIPILVFAAPTDIVRKMSISVPALAGFLALISLLNRGYVRSVGAILALLLLLIITANNWLYGGVRSASFSAYFLVIIIAGLLLGERAALVYGGLSVLAALLLYIAEVQGLIVTSGPLVKFSDWFLRSVVLVMGAVLLRSSANRLRRALARTRSNEISLTEYAKDIAIFHALAEHAVDAVLIGTLDGMLTYANAAAYAMFGYDAGFQEMIALTYDVLTPEDMRELLMQTIIPTALQTGNWHGDLRQQRKNATTFDVHFTAFSMRDENDEPVALAAIIRDVTVQKEAEAERERLQQEVIDAQRQALEELSMPIIPVYERTGEGGVIVMPLVGSFDAVRAGDLVRALLRGISTHEARVVILDITGVPVVDSSVASYINKAIQAARLKGARVIITGISDAVAETIVDLGIDWDNITTLRDLQAGLVVGLHSLGVVLNEARA